MILLALFFIGVVFAADSLKLGYPTKLAVKKGTSCVIDVTSTVGASLMRVYVDVNDLGTFITQTKVSVYAGRYRSGGPSNTGGGGAVTKQENGDVLLSIDRPTFAGIPDKWWILIESDGDVTALVTAVMYDIAERPRVDIDFTKRSGLIAVEDGASEIFSAFVKQGAAKKILINIDTAKLVAFADSYEVYVNIVNQDKLLEALKNVSWQDIAALLKALASAFTSGSAANLPTLLTPTADKCDMTLKPGFFGGYKTEFALPQAAGDALVMVAIVVKKNNLVPFNGKLTAYTVKFSLDTDDGNPNYTDGTCGAINKRSVAQSADTCANKPCSACLQDGCDYCLSAAAGTSKCVSKASSGSCATKAADMAQCTACKTASDKTTCAADSTHFCQWCSVVSAGAPTDACTDKFTCAEAMSAMTTTTNSTAATTTTAPAGSSTAAPTKPSSASSIIIASLSLLIAFIALF